MLHRIIVDVVAETFELLVIPDDVFPEPSLPNATFAAGSAFGWDGPAGIVILFIEPTDSEFSLDPLPTCREIRIATRQAPDTVKVVGKHHHGNCSKRSILANQSHGVTQESDSFLSFEEPPTTIGHNGEKIGLAWNHPSTVVGHCRNPKCRIVARAADGGFHPPYMRD
jgi:hypothetical protein